MLVARSAEHLQSLFTKALKTVRAGPWFERATPKQVSARGFDPPGYFIQEFDILDSARSGNHPKVTAADLGRAHLYDRVGPVKFAARQFEGLLHAQHLFDTRQAIENFFGLRLVLVADRAHDSAALPPTHMRRIAQSPNLLQQMLKLLGGVIGTKDKDHGNLSNAECRIRIAESRIPTSISISFRRLTQKVILQPGC